MLRRRYCQSAEDQSQRGSRGVVRLIQWDTGGLVPGIRAGGRRSLASWNQVRGLRLIQVIAEVPGQYRHRHCGKEAEALLADLEPEPMSR